MTPLLSIEGLSIAFGRGPDANEVVRNIGFEIYPGETIGLVGESGSGKSVTALSVMGLLPARQAQVRAGRIMFEGQDLRAMSEARLRRIRGARIGLIFQEPMTSLNPVLTIGRQMTEALAVHRGLRRAEAAGRAVEMLGRAGIPDPASRLGQFPHEFSGGMRQRMMIAMTMALEPALLIADEPTTALDVTIQAQILDLMRAMTRDTGTSLLLITHDMGVVAEMADRVVVMCDGRIVESNSVETLFSAPADPYTRMLLNAVPRIDGPGRSGLAAPGVLRPAGPVLEFRGISKTFSRRGLFSRGPETRALVEVSLAVEPGETVALVGESGSGKSTLGRVGTRLADADHGQVLVAGEDIGNARGKRLRNMRSTVQMVFQDPFASLDPRFTTLRTIAEPLAIHGQASGRALRSTAAGLLERVGLATDMLERLPHEFSGGQRQRIAIARALAANPRVIVADEPTSALDVSVQAQVLDLLVELQDEQGLAFLFITHDLSVVRRIAHRVAVMRAGRIVELGGVSDVLDRPAHPYTRSLIDAAPVPDPARRGRERLPVTADFPSGPLVRVAQGHWMAS